MSSAARQPRSARLARSIVLPNGFRVRDILDFHRRDALAISERTRGDYLEKGLIWEGRPACLAIRFDGGRADITLSVDGASQANVSALTAMARRMLGLLQPVDDFERAYRTHPQLGALIIRQTGLRVPLLPTPFEALTWAITGQQISLAAAISLRRNLIQIAGSTHSCGLACYPDAQRVANLSETQLRRAGLSHAKARTMLSLSREIAEDRLPLDAWMIDVPVEEIRDSLQRMSGIGPWTVNYLLLRGFGWLDSSLHGDAAVRRKLQRLLGSTDKISEDHARSWLGNFSPWRALAAAHLWAMPP